MVYLVRTADIQNGKTQEAFELAAKIAAHINQDVEGMQVMVLRNLNGPLNQVSWVAGYESLAALETLSAQLGADPGYQELAAEAQTLFVGSSFIDNLYQTVP